MSILCETLSASRSAYYAWRQDELGQRRREDNRLMPTIRSIFWEHHRRYGARRIDGVGEDKATENGVPVPLLSVPTEEAETG